MSNPLLRAEKIGKYYQMGPSQLHVLKGVTLDVRDGEFVAIMGASGSGKSTLLHILGALDVPNIGRVLYEGKNLFDLGAAARDRVRNRTFGFVFQFYHLLPELSVLENAIMPRMIRSSVLEFMRERTEARERVNALLERVGLADRLKHRPNELSGGERQRVAIARALCNDPRVLLADEPTGNLDASTGEGILNILLELNRAGQTIVMVTHDRQVARHADRTLVLKDGAIASDTPAKSNVRPVENPV